MRTTIDLDDDLLRTAKAMADAKKVTLSRIISDLAWAGLQPTGHPTKRRNGFPLLEPLPLSQPVTPEHIAALLETADLEDGL